MISIEKLFQNNDNINLLVEDVKNIINNGRAKVAAVANAGINMSYWQIGERINREVLEISVHNMVNELCRQYRHN